MSSWPRRVFFGEYVFEVSEEVYEPAEDTFLVARNLTVETDTRVLDMGTGCGILAILAARNAGKVVAVDINPYAVRCTSRNAQLNGVSAKVETRLGNLFQALEAEEEFDLIIFNAPYLPVDPDERKSWIEKAWSGGKSGRTIIDRFINTVSQHLSKKGRVLLVQSSLSDIDETLKQFLRHGLRASIADEEKLPYEKVVLIEARSL
jgi:release factor glutamine methyltransferase